MSINTVFKTLILLLTAYLPVAQATLASSTGSIANLRIEGTIGFIGLTQNMNYMSTCGGRVWIDMNSVIGRSVYANE